MRAVVWGSALVSLLLAGCGGTRTAYVPATTEDYLRAMTPVVQPVARNRFAELSEITKSQFDAWSDCVLAASNRYFNAQETAEVVVRAAMTACFSQESALQTALNIYNDTGVGTFQLMEIRKNIVRDVLVERVIRVREGSKAVKNRTDAWAECMIDATLKNLPTQADSASVIKSAFTACQASEDAVKATLADMYPNEATTMMDERKKKAVPILANFIDQLRSSASNAPKRPEKSI